MKRFAAIFFIILIGCSSCSLFKSKDLKSAKELALDGMDEFNSNNYKSAIESFEKLKDWYPFSKYAILAELKIADAHYRLQEYEEAVFAYEEFENLHPRNEAIPYVVYQIGLSYFEQMDTVDRDQTTALKAIETFERLNKQFPDNEYHGMALHHNHRRVKYFSGIFHIKLHLGLNKHSI